MSVVAALFVALISLHGLFAQNERYCRHSVHVHLIWGQHCDGQH
jgi:predicted DNA-binding protein with PD1-like motif